MHFIVLTLYPEIFSSFLSFGLLGKAQEEGVIKVDRINFRKYGTGKHASVDSPPYGGGAGMVIRPDPVIKTLREVDEQTVGTGTHKVLISPQGGVFNQAKAIELSHISKPVVLVCGRFEGFDERIRHYVDEEISLGDFILMGGESVAMTIIESVSRLITGVIGNKESLEQESFNNDLLEHSQYTRPFDFEGEKVPDILLSGNHQKIADWRLKDSIRKTKEKRYDLYQRYSKNIKK